MLCKDFCYSHREANILYNVTEGEKSLRYTHIIRLRVFYLVLYKLERDPKRIFIASFHTLSLLSSMAYISFPIPAVYS